MARKIWTVERFDSDSYTADAAAEALALAMNGGLDYQASCRFVGYVAEQVRQSGSGSKIERKSAAQRRWDGAVRSGHRYAKGSYGPLYQQAGERLLSALAARYGLVDHAPPEIVWDWLAEHPGLVGIVPGVDIRLFQ